MTYKAAVLQLNGNRKKLKKDSAQSTPRIDNINKDKLQSLTEQEVQIGTASIVWSLDWLLSQSLMNPTVLLALFILQ